MSVRLGGGRRPPPPTKGVASTRERPFVGSRGHATRDATVTDAVILSVPPGRARRRAGGRRPQRLHSIAARWLGAVLLLAALAATGLWVWNSAPVPVENVIRADLARQGLGELSVTATGRAVHLAGVLPAGVTPDFVRSLAQGSVCSAWMLTRPCADKVTTDLHSTDAGENATDAAAAPVPTAAVPAAPVPSGAIPRPARGQAMPESPMR